MGLFGYKEKKFGKFSFVLLGLLSVALAVASVFGGVMAILKMHNWSKYLIMVVAAIVGMILCFFGLFLIVIAFSMINSWKSVKDGNDSIGTANKRLCEKCGRVITKNAVYCEHCGAKQETGHGLKDCPECKTKNSGAAKFCEKCGHEFKD